MLKTHLFVIRIASQLNSSLGGFLKIIEESF